jgi:GGDEF domain-containing protein
MIIVDRIQAEISRPFVIQGNEVRLSASIGMACCEEKYLDPLEMIHAADVMMYRVKMEFKRHSA